VWPDQGAAPAADHQFGFNRVSEGVLLRHSACPQILVGNKCDIDESKRAVPYSKGQALASEFGIKFFETSAKSNINVEEVSGPAAPL